MADDGITDGQVLDRRADGVDPTGVLVAQDHRQLGRDDIGEPAVDDVEVGAAQAGAADPDDDVVRPVRLRFRHVVQLRWLPVRVHSDRLHRFSLRGDPACVPVVAVRSLPVAVPWIPLATTGARRAARPGAASRTCRSAETGRLLPLARDVRVDGARPGRA